MAEIVSKPVVLIVEDNKDIQQGYFFNLRDVAEILQAFSIMAAENIFLAHLEGKKTISVVIMDGCIHTKGRTDTIPLIKTMREEGFTGPIVAASGSDEYVKEMIEAGCSHTPEGKFNTPELVRELLLK